MLEDEKEPPHLSLQLYCQSTFPDTEVTLIQPLKLGQSLTARTDAQHKIQA